MASKKSIGDLHSNITASANQFVSEFNRADNASARAAGNIDKEMDRLSKSISNKFSGVNIAKSILSGLGVGSGFAAVSLVAEKFVALWQEADIKAKEAQASIEKLNATFRELHNITRESAIEHMLPEGQIEARKKAIEELTAKISDLSARQADLMKDMGTLHEAPRGFISGTTMDPLGGRYGYGKNAKTLGDEISAESDKITEEIAAAYRSLGQLQTKLEKLTTEPANKAAESDRVRRVKALSEGLKAQEEAFNLLVNAQKGANDTTDETNKKAEALAEKYRAFADPLRQYTLQLAEINKLHGDGRLKAEEAAAAIERVQDAAFEARFGKPSEKPGDFDANEAADKLKKITDASKQVEVELAQMWNSVSDRAGQAFADMVLTGEASFGDLVDIVNRAVIEMVARMAIINPIMNMLFGAFTGFGILPAFFGVGARAAGGPVSAGSPYVVGENGPELFMPSASGNIIPNGGTRGLMRSQEAPIIFNYKIDGSITPAMLMPILKAQEDRTISRIRDIKSRSSQSGL